MENSRERTDRIIQTMSKMTDEYGKGDPQGSLNITALTEIPLAVTCDV